MENLAVEQKVEINLILTSLLCFSTIQGMIPKSRHFLFVDDIVDAFLLLAEQGLVGEIYNVGSSFEIPIVQLAHQLILMVSLGEAQE